MSKRRIKDDVNQVPLTAYLAPVQTVEVTPNNLPESNIPDPVCDKNRTDKSSSSTHQKSLPRTVTTNNTQEDSIKKRKHTSPEESNPPKRSNTQNTPPYNMAELKQMEDQLHTSLTTSLTSSLTQNLREELKEIINDSIKSAVDTLNRAASKLDDCSTSIQKHDDEIRGLKETNNRLLLRLQH